MENIKNIINRKKNEIVRSHITKCPICSSQASRVFEDGRYYIYCVTCGANTIAKEISAMSKELEDIYGK